MLNPLEPALPTLERDAFAENEVSAALEADIETAGDSRALAEIYALDAEFESRYKEKLSLQPSLSRSLVSFQANRGRAVYRWFKYKEAFSAGLVAVLLALPFRWLSP